MRHLLPRQIHAALDDELGNIGQPIADAHQRQAAGQIGKRHGEYGHLLKLAQRLDLPLRIVGRQPLGARRQLLHKAPARVGKASNALASINSSSSSGNSAICRDKNPLMAHTSMSRSSAAGCSLSNAR